MDEKMDTRIIRNSSLQKILIYAEVTELVQVVDSKSTDVKSYEFKSRLRHSLKADIAQGQCSCLVSSRSSVQIRLSAPNYLSFKFSYVSMVKGISQKPSKLLFLVRIQIDTLLWDCNSVRKSSGLLSRQSRVRTPSIPLLYFNFGIPSNLSYLLYLFDIFK